MYKKLTCITLVMILQQASVQAMYQSKQALIENGVVKQATHYHLIKGGKTLVIGIAEQPVEVLKKPKACFYSYNPQQAENVFLGQVEVSVLDAQTIAGLDKLIDSEVTLPVIKRAVITHCIKRGRIISFYDENNSLIDSCARYYGSIDIKSAESDPRLIKPHHLLRDLEEVKELKPRNWFVALFTSPYQEEIQQYK